MSDEPQAPSIIRSPTRARDLRANIREFGTEQGVIMTLERALDELAGIRHALRELTKLVDTCIDLTTKMTKVGGSMTRQIDELKRVRAQEEQTNRED